MDDTRGPMLLTGEKQLLALFVVQDKARQKSLLAEAERDTRVSGVLVRAYRWCYNNT